jgi:hypothetical protein
MRVNAVGTTSGFCAEARYSMASPNHENHARRDPGRLPASRPIIVPGGIASAQVLELTGQ